MKSKSNKLMDQSQIDKEAQSEINVANAITAPLLLAYRRCPRECWIRYNEIENDDEKELFADLPEEDIVLELEDDTRAFLTENRLVVSPDQLLRSVVSLCTLPSGSAALLVLSNNLSREECLLKLAFDSLVLSKNDFSCRVGLIKSRVGNLCEQFEISDFYLMEVVRLLNGLHQLVLRPKTPMAKDASIFCDQCRVAQYCLPDETNVLKGYDTLSAGIQRGFFAPIADREPYYVTTQGARLSVTGNELIANVEGETFSKPITEISALIIMGNIQITTQATQRLLKNGVPVIYLSSIGRFIGIAVGPKYGVQNALSIKGQMLCDSDPGSCSAIAREMIKAKIHNQRLLIMRNLKGMVDADYFNWSITQLAMLRRQVSNAQSTQTIMGYEGEAAAIYFDALGKYINACNNDFFMNNRNRRPPQDPVNALLSFGYTLLCNDITASVLSEGLNQWIGFMHTQRSSKPSLVLDLMEEFRPIIVDSLVINSIRRNFFKISDFEHIKEENVKVTRCTMKAEARRRFIELYENKVKFKHTHPIFGYQVSWRRNFSLQVKILCKVFRGELDHYQGIENK